MKEAAIVFILVLLLIFCLWKLSCKKSETLQNSCRDKLPNCKELSLTGQCEADPIKMFNLCPESCYLCDLSKQERKKLFDFNIGLCKNFSDDCSYLTDTECKIPYNKLQCRRTCGKCGI